MILSEFVCRGKLTWDRFVQLTATNPAKILGLYPRKGVIATGSDADIVIVDPGAEWELTSEQLHMATDYTPFEGRRMRGAIRDVVSRGAMVVRDGEWVGTAGHGQVLTREPRTEHGMRC